MSLVSELLVLELTDAGIRLLAKLKVEVVGDSVVVRKPKSVDFAFRLNIDDVFKIKSNYKCKIIIIIFTFKI